MSDILIGIWQNAPVWVWPLFFVLLAIGLIAMKTRNSSIIPYFFYPLFDLTAGNDIAGLVHSPMNWLVFAGSRPPTFSVKFLVVEYLYEPIA